ncbi:MAG: EpsG family protein [Fusobacteriaceae bacterium]
MIKKDLDKNMKSKKKRFDIVGIIFLIILFTGVRLTNDSENYKNLYNNLELAPDLGFYIISKIIYFINGNELYLINFYYLLSIFFMYIFLKRYDINFNFIILNLVIYTFFFHLNQIRYFLGFYLYLYCVINKFSNNNLKALIFGFISILFHKTIILLYLFVFIYNTSIKNYIRRLFLIGISISLCYNFLLKIILKMSYFSHYTIYIGEEKKISIEGWLYSIFPFIISLFIILSIHLFLRKRIQNDKFYLELFKLCLFPIAFIFISKEFLDIIHRYIIIFNVINLSYYTYVIRYFKKNNKINMVLFILILSIFNYFWTFELGIILGKETHKSDLIKIYKNHILYKNLML